MKKEDLLSFSWIILVYIYMLTISNFVENPSYQKILGLMGLGILFLGLIGQEMYLKMKYAGYKLLKGYIINFRQEYQFLVERIEETRIDGGSATKIILSRPYNHPRYGELKEVIINVPKSFFENLDFVPQKNALYIYGMSLDHPSVSYALLKESRVITDHANPIPVFDLLLSDKVTVVYSTGECNDEVERIRKLYEEEHQKVIRLEEENAGLRNEVQALLKSKMDFNKQVVEGILAYREAYGDLLTASKYLTSRVSVIPINQLVMGIVVIGILIFMWKNPDYLLWFFEHPIHTSIIIISIGLTGYIIYRKRGR